MIEPAETLSAAFQQRQGGTLIVDDKAVHQIVKVGLAPGLHRMRAVRGNVASDPVQGLHIKVENGQLLINRQTAPEMVLWADSSPETVDLGIVAKSECMLKIWNVWKVGGLAQAWVGNAGMVVEVDGDAAVLRCSNGVGEVDLENLVVALHGLPPLPAS